MIIGTAGHIDHGKTALVRALTGVDTDRLKEEKARGISIDLGFAYQRLPDGATLGFVDVPGHEKFVHNMLAGATGIDFVLLAVAVDDGVMPQTREHLAIIDLLGIENGVVALTKADLADADRRAAVCAEIRDVLAGTGLATVEIVPVSIVSGEGMDELGERLAEAARREVARAAEGRFRLAVDRCFTLPGAGTVVTGTVLSGEVAVGDRVLVSSSGLTARVRSIHAQNRVAERGRAGDRCALNLAGERIAKDAISRGDVVLDPDLHAPAERIDARLRVLASETRPIGQWMPVRLHHAANDVAARLVLLGDAPIAPGASALVQLVLEHPVAAAVGDRFVIRDTSAQRTIGGGRFLDLRGPARKRRSPERLAQLAAQSLVEPAAALAALLDAPPLYVDITGFARDRALSDAQMRAIVEPAALVQLPSQGATLAVSQAVWERLGADTLAILAAFHKANPDLAGVGVERLRTQLQPRLPAAGFRNALSAWVRGGAVSLEGAWVRLAGHVVRLTPEDEALWHALQPLLAGGERFRPPRVRDIAALLSAAEPQVRRVMKHHGRNGRIHEIAHDHFFLRATVSEMVGIIVELAQQNPDGEFSAAQFRDRIDSGRKVAIQVLEFFDRHGVTLRRGDMRRVNKHRLDLFADAVQEATGQLGGASVGDGREASPVGRPDFKSGKGREPVLGGFDSHSHPPCR